MALNSLPFDCPNPAPLVEIGTFQIPKYGSLTVAESISLSEVMTPDLRAMLDGDESIEVTLYLRMVLAAILLISRYDAALTLDAMPDTPIDIVFDCSNFLISESRDGSGETRSDEDSDTTDWGSVWWKLQRHYPHESRFSRERFGGAPLSLVRQALESIEQAEVERLSAEAASLSLHGAYSLRCQGVKDAEVSWFNPWQRSIDVSNAKSEVPIESARVFLALTAEQKVPGWVVELIDVDKFRLAIT